MRIKECIIISCYYRPHHGDEITTFVETYNKVFERYPKDLIILTGDMSFPGFNWQNDTIKYGTPSKILPEQFQSFYVKTT